MTLPADQVGTPAKETISATGGTTPYHYQVTSDNLPPGLLLADNGVISGTPTTAGQYQFTVTVTDSSPSPQKATQQYMITVDYVGSCIS